ncbi:MAG: hypothetical protein ABIH41_00015 [Nanoarchaeota archaeon]
MIPGPEQAPDIDVTMSLSRRGYVPRAIWPILSRRMEYKRNPTAVNKRRAIGLKWVLVTSYGYLRFREFKLGLGSSHMAVCAYARDTLVRAMRMAEERGFTVVHGIVDSLYIHKKGITEEEARTFCSELEAEFGIPCSMDCVFTWIAFLPSINDPSRPVPARYFGAMRSGEIKVRGLEMRQRNTPRIVKEFQRAIITMMGECSEASHMRKRVPHMIRALHATIKRIPSLDATWLSRTIYLGKTDYVNDTAQRQVVQALQAQGITARAGEKITYVHTVRGAVSADSYVGDVDVEIYRRLLVRSLFVVLQTLGYEWQTVEMMAEGQTTLLSHGRVEDVDLYTRESQALQGILGVH